MCGLAGVVGYDLPEASRAERARRLRDRLRHRGPDGEGLVSLPHASLAHTRLALVDAEGGAQPRASPDGRFTLVFNGEVYNLPELRAELSPGWDFRSRSDAEVVLAAFAAWGERCVPRLEGMFSFFVWDAVTEEGFAARDLLGVKPFVYATEPRGMVFASEAKGLLALLPGPPRAHREALLEALVAPCFSGVERPLFEGMQLLPPGHCLRVTREGVRVWRWGRHALTGPYAHDRRALASRVREALDRAVARTLQADHPVGLFLSGGLDSSLLAHLACRQGARPRAFTVRFEDQDRYDYTRSHIVGSDDTPFALACAERLGLEHHLVPVERARLDGDLDDLCRHNDALPVWEQELAQHHLARAASRRVKAVLVGDAADETHYGYHFLLDPEATAGPEAILRRLGGAPVKASVMARPIEHFSEKYRILAQDSGHRWEGPEARLLATSFLVLERWLPRLLHNGDAHTMAHGLEARVPFADRGLLAVASAVPPSEALAGATEKSLLREAARAVLPEDLRLRKKSALPKDQGAGSAYQRLAARAIADEGDLLGAVLDLDALRTLSAPEHRPDERERALLFRVLCLARWARIHGVRL
ncbi:MAG: asparagine synthase (glutamine-hydrolyzing) [Deltaproteobacteria bacterium]|nr:asparagine synthase (glutamine-hydrolyzing) [Deltaproteobacteria bacterium]